MQPKGPKMGACRTDGGGILNFGLSREVQPKGPKMGDCRTDQHQIWGLVELTFFLTKYCFQN